MSNMKDEAFKFATGQNGGVPPEKEGQQIDIRIAHWALWGPRQSGLYETTRELVQAEMEIEGVLPGMCLVPTQTAPQSVKDAYIMGRYKDPLHPELNPQNWGWAYKHADIHVIHFSLDKRLAELEPKVFFAHGTPTACLASSMRPEDEANAFGAGAEWVSTYDGTIVTSTKAKKFWEVFDNTGERVHQVSKGIDLDWWRRSATIQKMEGEPSVLFGETWREIKHPADLFYAMNELYRRNNKARLNMWGLNFNQKMWLDYIARADFQKFIGTWPIPNYTDYPEHRYSRGDMLVSPVKDGDLSRVHQEAMACGCPVIAWDSDEYHENYAWKLAKPFSIMDLADKLEQTYNDVRDDPDRVQRECRRIAEEQFDIRKEAKQVVSVLREIVNKRKK
jgi:glycosyltransferase involved in cell wall biosynthesis